MIVLLHVFRLAMLILDLTQLQQSIHFSGGIRGLYRPVPSVHALLPMVSIFTAFADYCTLW